MISIDAIIEILAFCIQVIAGASYFNIFRGSGTIHAGYKPKEGWGNFGFFSSYAVFAFGLISLLFAVVELLLAIRGLTGKNMGLDFLDSMILRAVIYIIKGIATLGTSGDLGIAAGSLEMIIGVVMIIYTIVTKGLNCSKGGKK